MLQIVVRAAQGERIALRPETRDAAYRDVGEIGLPAEFLPRVHIADVHLDERNADAEQGVAQRDAGMGEGARVQQDEVGLTRTGVHAFDQFRL